MGLHSAKESAIKIETLAKTKKPVKEIYPLVEDFCLTIEESLEKLKTAKV
jgi:hypothetical protein